MLSFRGSGCHNQPLLKGSVGSLKVLVFMSPASFSENVWSWVIGCCCWSFLSPQHSMNSSINCVTDFLPPQFPVYRWWCYFQGNSVTEWLLCDSLLFQKAPSVTCPNRHKCILLDHRYTPHVSVSFTSTNSQQGTYQRWLGAHSRTSVQKQAGTITSSWGVYWFYWPH